MVRAEGARLGLAHADAIEPHATSALADERLIVQWRRSQDNAAPREHERRRPEDHREALNAATKSDREAQHGKARHRQAQHGETQDREAWRPQDDGSPQDRQAVDAEASDAPQLRDPQEAPLTEV